MNRQHSIKNSIKAVGMGLHSGMSVTIGLHPAPENTGIVFRRHNASEGCSSKNASTVLIPAIPLNVVNTTLATTLGKDGVEISTVEHLMAAFAGVGIDNCYVDVDASELPIFDGSAAPYIYLIQRAGVKRQQAMRSYVQINKPICVTKGAASALLQPYRGFRCRYSANFDHPSFDKGNSSFEFDGMSSSFCKDVARARTFAFSKDIEALRKQNLVRGGSLECAVLFDEHGAINKEGLRYPNEPVRHKLLDAIGDLYVLGRPILGAFTGVASGHWINNLLLNEVLRQRDAWEIVVPGIEFTGNEYDVSTVKEGKFVNSMNRSAGASVLAEVI